MFKICCSNHPEIVFSANCYRFFYVYKYIYRVVQVDLMGKLKARALLESYSETDRKDLVKLMLDYIKYDIVRKHIDEFPDIHEGEVFFTWHRKYLSRMEKFLSQNGRSDFVPLPMWDTTTLIPQEFMVYKHLPEIPKSERKNPQNRGQRVDGSNLKPFSEFIRPEWYPPRICDAKSVNHTSFIGIMTLHSRIHPRIGGIMTRGWSPCAPIFWCFHSFLVSLYEAWKFKCK